MTALSFLHEPCIIIHHVAVLDVPHWRKRLFKSCLKHLESARHVPISASVIEESYHVHRELKYISDLIFEVHATTCVVVAMEEHCHRKELVY